jgi:hypothetical protein
MSWLLCWLLLKHTEPSVQNGGRNTLFSRFPTVCGVTALLGQQTLPAVPHFSGTGKQRSVLALSPEAVWRGNLIHPQK